MIITYFIIIFRPFVGILLHGVSGSGKSLLGRSLPAILNHPNFISASGPGMLKFFGIFSRYPTKHSLHLQFKHGMVAVKFFKKFKTVL